MTEKTTSTEWMDRVRVALADCGETHYEVSRATGIRVSRLYDFVNREKSLGAANFGTRKELVEVGGVYAVAVTNLCGWDRSAAD